MELKGSPPENYIYGAIPDKLKDKIKEGIDNIKKHPETLGTGDPKVYKEGLKSIEEGAEKLLHKAEDFFKNTFDFAKKHPEVLLAKTEVKIFED